MQKLSQATYQKALPLLEQVEINFPLIRSVLEVSQPGSLYADNEQNPTTCMAFTTLGFSFFFGDENNLTFNQAIARLIFERSDLSPRYLLWYKPPPFWQEKLAALPQSLIRKRQRIRFIFQNDQMMGIRDEPKLPPTYELKKLQRQQFMTKFPPELDLPMRFWHSPDDFLKSGFGFYITKGKQTVGLCYSAGVAARTAEVDIAILPEHQGLGLGTALGIAFVNHALENNIELTWDCFDYNQASVKLARRLGFVEKIKYPFYSFNRPVYDDLPAQLCFGI